jgi:hypothetical protein
MKHLPLLKKWVPLNVWLRLVLFIGLPVTGLVILQYSSMGDLLNEQHLASFLARMRGT